MRINVTARRFKMSKDLKEFAEEEAGRLKKYYQDIIDTDVILSWEKQDRLAEINVSVYGTILTASERSQEMRKSIGKCVTKLERQIKKYKDRLKDFEHDKINGETIERIGK
jgi:putative sigma-54 modulation protein